MQNEIKHVRETAELLHSKAEVETALDTMAQQINQMLSDRNPLVLCVANGGLVVAGQLLTRLTIKLANNGNDFMMGVSEIYNKMVGGSLKSKSRSKSNKNKKSKSSKRKTKKAASSNKKKIKFIK